ncbi:hypothetical protein EE612_016897, partial [Oryza sativa]
WWRRIENSEICTGSAKEGKESSLVLRLPGPFRGGVGRAVQVERRPERVERARPPGAEPRPRLAGSGPMQQAHRPRVEVAAAAEHVVAAEAVLVPPVLDRRHVPREHQQEGRQRPELVDAPRRRLLYLHPPLDAPRVARPPPPGEVEHHDARVEVARPAPRERPGELLVRPEPVGEVLGEVRVAVLRRADGAAAEVGAPELGDIVDDDEVGVEVDDPAHAGLEEIGQIVAGVVERLLQGLPHRRGDEAADAVGVEVVDLELELREHGADEVAERRVGDEEVEEDALGARGVLHDGVDRGDGAPEVLLVQRNRDVDERWVADIAGGVAAVSGIAERGGATEGEAPGAPRDLAREADVAVKLRRPDGLGGREGLQRRGQHHHHHGGGEEPGHPRRPQHGAPLSPARPPLPPTAAAAAAGPRPPQDAVQARDGVVQRQRGRQVVVSPSTKERKKKNPRDDDGRSGGLTSPQLHRLALPRPVDRRVEWGRSEGESMRSGAR